MSAVLDERADPGKAASAALAALVHTLGLPPGHELVLFSMARTVGWIAHACEQLRHGRLIRPRARYVGPAPGRGAG